MRRVTIVAVIAVALAFGMTAFGAAGDSTGRIVFVSERALDLGRTRFVAVSSGPRAEELGIAPARAVLANDGRTYAAPRGSELLVGRLGDGEPRVVAVSPFVIADVVWSPERTRIAFTGVDPSPCTPGYKLCVAYHLFVVSANGGAPVQVASRARVPVWSPNGRWLAYAGEWNTYDANDNGASGTPYVVRPDGSGARRLVRVRGVRSLAWGPRSDRIVVATGRNVVAMVPLAGRARRLGSGTVVAWSRRGRVAFVDGTNIVVSRATARGSLRFRTRTTQVYALVWSPSGSALAYAGHVPGTFPAPRAVSIVRLRGGTRTPLTSEPWQDVTLSAWRGSRLFVATARPDWNDTDVYTMRPDGSDVRELTRTADYEFAPTASPDGTSIAFARILRSGYPQSALFTVDAEGRRWSQLTSPPPGTDDQDPAWAPRGTSIVFVRSHAAEGVAQSDLFVADAASRTVRQLTTFPGDVRGPAWSPDGTQIAFGRGIGLHTALAVVNADGSGYRELTSAYGSPLPAWSPDGGRIAFVDPRTSGLAVLELAAGRVTQLPVRADSRSAPAWSPAGTRLVYLADDADLHSVAATGDDDMRLTAEPGQDRDPDWSRAAP